MEDYKYMVKRLLFEKLWASSWEKKSPEVKAPLSFPPSQSSELTPRFLQMPQEIPYVHTDKVRNMHTHTISI
jgi:hypothetical protein